HILSIFAIPNRSLAQLVQSAALTGQRSPVRAWYDLPKSPIRYVWAFFMCYNLVFSSYRNKLATIAPRLGLRDHTLLFFHNKGLKFLDQRPFKSFELQDMAKGKSSTRCSEDTTTDTGIRAMGDHRFRPQFLHLPDGLLLDLLYKLLFVRIDYLPNDFPLDIFRDTTYYELLISLFQRDHKIFEKLLFW